MKNPLMAALFWALIAGFFVVLLLQPAIAGMIGLPGALAHLAFPFQLCIGSAVAFLVAVAPPGRAAA